MEIVILVIYLKRNVHGIINIRRTPPAQHPRSPMTSARKKLMEYAKLKSTVVHDGFVNHVEQDHVISVVSGLMFALRMEKRNQNGSNSNQMTNTQRTRRPRLAGFSRANNT